MRYLFCIVIVRASLLALLSVDLAAKRCYYKYSKTREKKEAIYGTRYFYGAY